MFSILICKSQNLPYFSGFFPDKNKSEARLCERRRTVSPRIRIVGRNAGRFALPVKNTSSDEKVLKRRERLHAASLTRDGRSLWCNRGVHCATLIPFGRIVSSESHLRWGPIHSLAITFACRLPTRRVWMTLRGEPDLPFHSRSTRNVSQCQSWLKELFFELHVWYTFVA